MSTTNIEVSIPLDDDGFLRRECPYCKREFKLFAKEPGSEEVTDNDEAEVEEEEDELFCPYCGQSSEKDSFWTQDQVKFFQEITYQKVVQPMLDDFSKDIEKLNKPGGFIQVKVDKTKAKKPVITPEDNDMIKVTADCCNKEIKIEEDWEKVVHCVFCGQKIGLN